MCCWLVRRRARGSRKAPRRRAKAPRLNIWRRRAQRNTAAPPHLCARHPRRHAPFQLLQCSHGAAIVDCSHAPRPKPPPLTTMLDSHVHLPHPRPDLRSLTAPSSNNPPLAALPRPRPDAPVPPQLQLQPQPCSRETCRALGPSQRRPSTRRLHSSPSSFPHKGRAQGPPQQGRRVCKEGAKGHGGLLRHPGRHAARG